ncbi:hypothetical protein B0A48_13137 [Cryoendolithus antarcticus]|uniref:G-patch domain-containing protein n=1 Tax=Cryoendolithus antarcticus TaxID=1507870 RepID=A0A1V8SN98_9PEZI|nr:hypothetical protein B0A48_13137 [Cryoendolithus antarcticus]
MDRYPRQQRTPPRSYHDYARDEYDKTVHAQHYVQEAPQQYRGDKDVGSDSQPMTFLLVRGLKPATSEAVFAKGLEKLYRNDDASTGALPTSLRSVILIRDREGDGTKSLGFGFAWFHRVTDAVAALKRARELGDEFTISSQIISVDMPHKGVFPRADSPKEAGDSQFTFTLPATGETHMYRDLRFYPTETVINIEGPARPIEEPAETTEDVSKSATSAVKKAKKRALDDHSQPVAPKRVHMAPAMAALANRWTTRSADLHAEKEPEAREASAEFAPATGVNATGQREQSTAPETTRHQTFAYDNPPKSCCYLCNRMLGDSAKLRAHVEKSQLHATNTENEDTIKDAYQRMEKAGVAPEATIVVAVSKPPTTTTPSDEATSQYVDRAALRRQEEKARNAAANYDKPKGFSLKGAKAATKSDDASTAAPLSKGLGMLQKHGYTAGQGLGAVGSTGLAVPIATDLYAAGVGLGHAGGKVGDAVTEAERATKGDQAGYLDKMKEVSRARYEALNDGGKSKEP